MKSISHALVAVSLCAAPLTTLPGCFILGSPGPSAVGQGHQYRSGDPTFDEFFENLFAMQVELADVPDQEKHIRHDLAKKLDVDADASANLLAKKAEKLAKDMAAKGIGLKMTVEEGDADTKPSAELHTAGSAPTDDDKAFVEAVEKAVQKELELARAMDKRHRQIEQLQTTIVELEPRVDATFRLGGPRKKAEVRKNLDDAGKLIPLMETRAEDVRDAARETAKKLAAAVDTDDGRFSHPEPPPEAEEPATEETKTKPAKHAPRSHGTPAATPAKPKPEAPPAKPKPAAPPSDFEP